MTQERYRSAHRVFVIVDSNDGALDVFDQGGRRRLQRHTASAISYERFRRYAGREAARGVGCSSLSKPRNDVIYSGQQECMKLRRVHERR